MQPLLLHFAPEMLLFVLEVFGWLALAERSPPVPWAALMMGRTDRQQSHRALSQFLWPAVAASLVICGALSGGRLGDA